MHEDHRKRLRKKFMIAPDIMEDHELLELLLTYSIPRKDTNALAHDLLKRFGSISGIFDSSFDALKSINGVGDATALFLKVISSMIRGYSEDKYKPKRKTLNAEEVAQILFNKFVCRSSEECIALALFNPKRKLIFCDVVSKGSVGSVNLYSRDLMKLVLNFDTKYAVIAHNHPSGLALPSNEDLATTTMIKNLLRTVGVTLLDHVIVSSDDYVCLSQSKLGKKYL